MGAVDAATGVVQFGFRTGGPAGGGRGHPGGPGSADEMWLFQERP
jgi:hypothetical protein